MCENFHGHPRWYGWGAPISYAFFSTCKTGVHMVSLCTMYGYTQTKCGTMAMKFCTHKEMCNFIFCENFHVHPTLYCWGTSILCELSFTCEIGGHMPNLQIGYGYAPTKPCLMDIKLFTHKEMSKFILCVKFHGKLRTGYRYAPTKHKEMSKFLLCVKFHGKLRTWYRYAPIKQGPMDIKLCLCEEMRKFLECHNYHGHPNSYGWGTSIHYALISTGNMRGHLWNLQTRYGYAPTEKGPMDMKLCTHKEIRNFLPCVNYHGHPTSYGQGESIPCMFFSTCEMEGHMENLCTRYRYAQTKQNPMDMKLCTCKKMTKLIKCANFYGLQTSYDWGASIPCVLFPRARQGVTWQIFAQSMGGHKPNEGRWPREFVHARK